MNRNVGMLLKVKRERIENGDEPIVLYTNTKEQQLAAAVVDQLFKCCLCEELFGTKARLKSHISVFHLSYLPFRCQYCQPPMCHYSATSAEAQKHQDVRHSDKLPCFFTEINETQKSQLKSILKMSIDDGPTVQQQQFQHNKEWNSVIAPQTFGAPQYQFLPFHQPFSPFTQPSIIQNSIRSTHQLIPQTTAFSLSNSSNMPVLQEEENFPVFPTEVNSEETGSPRENSEVGKKCRDSDENYSQEPAHGRKAPIGRVELTCPECQFQWSDLDQLQGHLERLHKFSETTKYLLLGKKADELAKLNDTSKAPFSPKKVFKKQKMSAFAETQKSQEKFDMKMCNYKSNTCAKCSQLVGCTHHAEHVWAKHLQIKPYVCTLCTFRSVYVMNMVRHCGTHKHNHVEFIDETDNYKYIFEKMATDCFSPEIKRSLDVQVHSKKQNRKSEQDREMRTCNLCSTTVQRRVAMNHVWGKHMVVSLQCSKCHFKGRHYSAVQKHINGEHGGEDAQSVSMKSLLQREALNMKQLCFGDNLEKPENSTSNKLNSSKSLTGNHLKDLTISCFYCPYETRRRCDLTKHTRIRHPEKVQS